MTFLDWLLGKSLRDSDSESQHVGIFRGIPILGLDALSSSAYGTEAALTILLPLGALSLNYIVPISSVIIVLLLMVFVSYRQTIQAYPNGGGSYTVAKENLGRMPGLLAAGALMLDYLLTVAVGIAAGVGALISALPFLQPHILLLCLLILALITVVNLRGTKESGKFFLFPTYLFIFSLLMVLILGVTKSLLAGGHPAPMESLPVITTSNSLAGLSLWLLLRAFASGCAAMTGIEAVSNGVRSFQEPVVKNARRTLTAIVLILVLMLACIAYLARAYGIIAANPDLPGYESVVSQIIRAVVGKGVIYFITIGSTISVLALSANTAFADFPRLCQIVANDHFLPHAFADRGRRLVFSHGIFILATLAAIILIFFGGVTDRLIPLYAIGAFLAFTLSQAGMVAHWTKKGVKNNLGKLIVNALGAAATGVTTLVILVSKFTEGGWISVTLIVLTLFMFYRVNRHYRSVRKQIDSVEPMTFQPRENPIVIVPFSDWSKITQKALTFAMELSTEVYAAHVAADEFPDLKLSEQWKTYVADPAVKAKVSPPELVKLPSPFRKLFGPLFSFVDEIEKKYPNRDIAIVVPHLSELRWYEYFFHNQRAILLKTFLFMRRDPKIILITIPWYLNK